MANPSNPLNSTTLPDELNNDQVNHAKVKLGFKHWAQLVSWSWTSSLAFADDDAKTLGEELKLKVYFRTILQDQAKYRYAATRYGDDDAARTAKERSETIKKVVMGEQTAENIELTLPQVYKKLTDQECIFTDKPFMDMFRCEVTVDEFAGGIRKDETGEAKYVAMLAYPPRPELGEFTVTEDVLNDWMRDRGSGDYVPPSAYIPLSAS